MATTTRSARSLIFIVSTTLATAGFPCTTHKGFPANVCSLPSSYGAYTTPNANASDARRRRRVPSRDFPLRSLASSSLDVSSSSTPRAIVDDPIRCNRARPPRNRDARARERRRKPRRPLPRAGATASTLANATTPTARETTTRHRERTNAQIARMFARRPRRLRARASTRDDDSMRVTIPREFHETCDSTAMTRGDDGCAKTK